MCFVENDESVVQRPSAHVGERGYLHCALVDVLLELGCRNHVVQCVVERLEVGVEFLLEVPGEETEFFTRLYRGARQDDSFHLLVAQGAYCQRYRGVGLAASGGPYGE